MTRYILATVLCILVGYGLVEAWPLIAGSSLSIISPENNAVYPDGIVEVRGRATRAAELTLDGAPVLREEDGDFFLTLTFPRGGSILTFRATDRFGRTVTATRAIFVSTANNQS